MDNEKHLDHDKLAVLMITQSESEAEIVHGLLEESGIHSVLETPVPHSLYPFTVDGLATIRIKVLESQLEDAREILHDCERNAREGGDNELRDDTDS